MMRAEALQGDEIQIAELLLERLAAGRETYGPWKVTDGRNYPAEALHEVLDCLHYCAAELVRIGRRRGTGRRRIYVCHPYRDDPVGNAARVRELCRQIVDDGQVPLGPQVYLSAFMDEATERERVLDVCLSLVEACDELRVYGDVVTEGMQLEIDHANAIGVPISWER